MNKQIKLLIDETKGNWGTTELEYLLKSEYSKPEKVNHWDNGYYWCNVITLGDLNLQGYNLNINKIDVDNMEIEELLTKETNIFRKIICNKMRSNVVVISDKNYDTVSKVRLKYEHIGDTPINGDGFFTYDGFVYITKPTFENFKTIDEYIDWGSGKIDLYFKNVKTWFSKNHRDVDDLEIVKNFNDEFDFETLRQHRSGDVMTSYIYFESDNSFMNKEKNILIRKEELKEELKFLEDNKIIHSDVPCECCGHTWCYDIENGTINIETWDISMWEGWTQW